MLMESNRSPPMPTLELVYLLTPAARYCQKITGDAEALTGYTEQDFLTGKPLAEALFHPDDADICADIFSPQDQTSRRHRNCRIIKPDGSVRIFYCTYRKQADVATNALRLDLCLQAATPEQGAVVLETAHNNLRSMLDNTDDYIYFKNCHHQFTSASQSLATLVDASGDSANLQGKTDYDIFPRELADLYYALEKLVFSGEVMVAHQTNPTRDLQGREGWVDDRKYPIKDDNGAIVGLFGIARDITELKLAEDKLREEQIFANTLLDSLPGIFYLYSYPELRLERWNKQHTTLLGYDESEMLGKSILDWHPMEQKEAIVQTVDQVMIDGYNAANALLLTKAGQGVPFHLTGVRIDSRGKQYFMGIGLDMSAQQNAESALRDSEHKYRIQTQRLIEAIRGTDAGAWEWNVQTDEAVFNDRWASMLGYTLNTLPQSSPGRFKRSDLAYLVYPGDMPLVAEQMTRCLNGEAEYFDCELRMRHKQGHLVWVLARGQIVERTEEGEPVRLSGTHLDITQRKHTEIQLRDSDARLRELAALSHSFIWEVDPHGRYTYVSDVVREVLGYAPEELVGRLHYYDLHPEAGREAFKELTFAAFVARKPFSNQINPAMTKSGGIAWLSTNGVPQIDAEGNLLGYCGSDADITERYESNRKLQLAANVFTYAREGIMITDALGNIIEVNATFSQITGYDRKAVLGKNPRFLQSGQYDSVFYAAMWQALLDHDEWSGEIWNRRYNGDLYAQLLTLSTVRDAAGTVQNYVGLFTDITPMKMNEQHLQHIAFFDALTNLPNRVLFADRLQQAMAQSLRRGDALAVAYLDLDGFKIVNDRYGHDVGDELLIALSQRMKTAMRDVDTLARLGGDEFVAILGNLEHPQDCEPILARLLQSVCGPVKIRDVTLTVSASIGVTIYPQDGSDAEQLLRHADQAMYQAKQAGKNRYHLFDVTHAAELKHRAESVERIRHALEKREFVLHYQPKVKLKTGEVTGAEALIRWQHPVQGLLYPAAFLPAIETQPLSIDLGEWVIATALAQMSVWQSIGMALPVSVNVGARHLQQESFASRLGELLAKHPNIPPHRLELEIMETSALEDVEQALVTLEACRALGVRLALDDFGTGYSSLTYLKRLPVDVLKIDQSFVRDMLFDQDDLAIVKGVIGLAIAFRRDVIAEGVETAAHGELLLSLGCELAQGYGIARPMPAAELPDWVHRWQQNPQLSLL